MDNRYHDFDSEERDALARSGITPSTSGCPAPDFLLAVNEGVIPEEAAAPVRLHLAACKACQALSADLVSAEVARPTTEERDRIRARIDAGIKPARKLAWLRWPMWAAAATAAAGLGVGVYFRSHQDQPSPVAEQRPVERETYRLALVKPPLKLPLAAAIKWRGEGAGGVEHYLSELGAALAPYRRDDFAAAVPLLRNLAANYPKADEPPFYLGVSLLELNQAAEAAAILEDAERLNPDALHDDVGWYLGVAWERNGDRARASAYLKPLCAADGPYRIKACEGIERLRQP